MRDWNETMGQNNQDVSNVNKSALLKFLRQNGVCSRAQISKAMGLTQASISKITAQLLEENIVQETGYISGEKGRRSVGITFNTCCKKVLGVRISRRSFGVGLFDLSGKMYESMTRQFTAETTLHHVIARIRDILQGYLEQSSEIAAIGVAVPGPINLRTSEIVLTTSMATSDWTNLNLRQEFGEFAVPISFSHDADAGALADWWFSTKAAGLGATLVHFLVGDGVGAGCVSNGEILNGYRRFSEEIGHVSVDVNGPKCRCGNRGCLELYCSTFAFMDFVSQGLPLHPESPLYRIGDLSPRDVFTAAKGGDPYARDCVDQLGRYVGYGVVNIINAYAPDLIVISNEMAWAGKQLLERVKEVVQERISPVVAEHVNIQLEDDWMLSDPILYGAAAVAVNNCIENPIMLLGK